MTPPLLDRLRAALTDAELRAAFSEAASIVPEGGREFKYAADMRDSLLSVLAPVVEQWEQQHEETSRVSVVTESLCPHCGHGQLKPGFGMAEGGFTYRCSCGQADRNKEPQP